MALQVSIIIPTYKPQYWIWECLNSLQKQTFPKEFFEVIVVLNGCNQPYYKQIEDYISKNLSGYNVTLIQTDIGGVSNARNIGIDISQGHYISFIDDDDYVSPSYIQDLFQAAIIGMIPVSNVIAFDDSRGTIMDFYLSNVYNRIKNKSSVSIVDARSYMSVPVAKLIEKNIIGTRRFNTKYTNGEDSLFMFEISDKITAIVPTSEKAIYYRRCREGSAVKRINSVSFAIKNSVLLIKAYSQVYFKNICDISLVFYVTRLMASVKIVLLSIITKFKRR